MVLCPTKCVVASYLFNSANTGASASRECSLRRPRIFGVHIHHEVGVWGEERQLTLRIAAIGAMRVGLDEFPNRKAIGGFGRGEGSVFTHRRSTYDSRMARGSRNAS